MLGKTPQSIQAIRPLRDGVISDFYVTEKMIEYFIKLVHQPTTRIPKIPRPKVVIGVPSGVTSVERKAVEDAARNAGAREVFLVEEPMAAAIGSNLPVNEPSGTMVVDMGGGTSEIAVISLGALVVNNSLRIAGDEMDEAIVEYAREVQKPVNEIINGVKDAIEDTPAELMADIVRHGIVLAGGTSLLRGMDKLMSFELQVPVHVSKDPITCVVRGCGKLLDDPALLEKVRIK